MRDRRHDRWAIRGYHGHLSANQIGRHCRQSLVLTLREAIFDRYIVAFDVAALLETLMEYSQELRVLAADHRHSRLLPACHQRPRRSAAESQDERAPPHSITSSARTRSVGGIVRPRVFAVFALMTSSNLVGCSTGSSPGFSPLKILSMKEANRK